MLQRLLVSLSVTVLAACPVAAEASPTSGVDARGGVWTAHAHPCPGGNRTDALHRDADGTLWVGCGTNAVGYGLFRSVDGGASWAAAPVSPANKFATYRVSSIARGHDGALYVAGFSSVQGNLEMVLRVNTAASPHPVTVTLNGVGQLGRQFHVGTYRELSDGRAIAEALASTNLLYRADASTGPSASDWVRELGTVQMLDMVVHNDGFYGAGSRINEPPRLFLPPHTALPAYQFETVELQSPGGWVGELWGIAANHRRVVAVGMDQDNSIGKIFVSGADPYDATGYVERSMSAITGDATTWARGVCMLRDRIVVVGERHPQTSHAGRVLLSDDGGASFSNITPPGAPAGVSKCVIEPDGSVVVAGAGGYVGIRQDPDWIFVHGFERP